MPSAITDRTLSTMELAELLQVRYATLHAWVRRGHISAPKRVVGKTWLWTPAEVKQARRIVKERCAWSYRQLQARSRAIFNANVKTRKG